MRLNVNNLKLIYNFLYKLLPFSFYSLFLKIKYFFALKSFLSLKNPVSLSEKIQWLKLYGDMISKSNFVDKIKIKDYVSSILPELNYAKIYQVSNSFEKIQFDKLPNSFVIKSNHGCGMNTIIKNKKALSLFDFSELNKLYTYFLKINFAFYNAFEMQYKNILPKIYVEEFINNNQQFPLNQYEIYCFNGEPKFIVDASYFQNEEGKYRKKNIVYDVNWSKLPFCIDFISMYDYVDTKPIFWDKLIEYSKILSSNFKFVRVDFFENDNILYFSELTFTPMSGFIRFLPKKYDVIYGDLLNLK